MKFAFIPKISLAICTLLSAGAYSQAIVDASSTSNRTLTMSEPNLMVKRAMENTTAARSYRGRMEMTGMQGATVNCDMEFVAPNRIRMTAHIIAIQDGSELLRFEGIIIGKDYYLNMDGTWTKQKDEIPDLAAMTNPKRVDELFKQTGANEPKFKLVGPDTINGVSVVEFEDPALSIEGHPGAFRVWTGVSDDLVHKFEAEVQTKPGDPSSKVRIAITYRDYNADIKIEPPI